jgi:hypothetical protein
MRGTAVERVNLILKFRFAGGDQTYIKGAARIKVDGSGGLMFQDVQSGKTERIAVSELESFNILSLNAITRPIPSRSQTTLFN